MSKVICGVIKTCESLDKDSHLKPRSIEIKLLKETLENHIQPVMEYFETSDFIVKGVNKTSLEGSLVSPTFIGGATSSTRKLVIPLVFTILGYDKSRGIYVIAPYAMKEIAKNINYSGPLNIKYEGDITKFLSWYLSRGVIYPFTVVRFFKLLYHPGGMEKLKELLRLLYGIFDVLLKDTLSTLKVPSKPNISCNSETNKYYVVYRRMRTFASFVLDTLLLKSICSLGNGLIIDQNVSYLEIDNEDIAYYYSAILNYMVYKVKTLNLGSFVRDQFGRPLKALKEAGLEWEELSWQKEVAKLSKIIHSQAREITLEVLGIQKNTPIYELIDYGRDEDIKKKLGVRVDKVLTELIQRNNNLKKIIEIIDGNVERNALIKALRRNVIEVKTPDGEQHKRKRKSVKKSKHENMLPLEKWLKNLK